MSNSQPISVGLIGAGGMGTRHAENLHRYIPGSRLSAVYDFDPGRARAAADINAAARAFEDPIQLINDETVEAVIIASPDATHVAYVLECLRCRKPVLCEKPLATNRADAEKVVDAELALGRRLAAVGFMRRFDPQHTAVRGLIDTGQLGRPILYKGAHRNASIPYSVSGEVVITNSAGHDIDAARWLLGQEVEEVFVRGVRSHDSFSTDTRDMILFQMRFGGDCLAAIEVFVAAEYGYEVSAEVICSGGTAATLQPDLALVRSKATRAVSVPGDWLSRFQDAYIAELSAWVGSLQTGQPFPGGSAWDGLTAIRVSDACVQSLNSGQPVAVENPPRPGLYGGVSSLPPPASS